MKTIQFQYEGYDEIHQAEEWCLEDQAEETRSRLGIPIWISYKIIPDAHTPPHPDLDAYLSHVCDSPKSTLVPKRTRKTKAKSEANVVLPVQLVLDRTNPIDILPGVLRDKYNRSDNTVSNGMDKRDDVQAP